MNSRRRIDQNVEKALKKIRELLLLNYTTGINLPEVKKALKNGEIFWFKNNPRAEAIFDKKTSKNIASVEALIISLTKNAYNTGRADALATKPTINIRSKTGQKELDLLKQEAVSAARGKTASTFINEKRGGFTISDRVWRASAAAKKEMEVIIQNAIKEGLSADDIAGKLKSYLNEPDKLFRRVKNKDTGKLEWSEAAKKYHPGSGVYRSSYKNAMRLARTEVNMAYRTAQWEQFKDDPTVIGFEVKLSNNHTLNGEPFHDICDELEGRYPKTFKFTGWHPQCRCNYFPIFITDNDFLNRIKARKEGKLDTWKPKQIEQLPSQFKNWYSNNSKRFTGGARVPLFLIDNQKLLTQIAGQSLPIVKPASAQVKTPAIVTKTPQQFSIDFPVKTNSDLERVIKNLDAYTAGKLFQTGFKRIDAERKRSANGSTDRDGRIWLSSERIAKVKEAMNYIRMGKETTFEQEDALSTLWHEMTHNKNPIPAILDRGMRDGPQRRAMELANEYVSRKTLPEFLEMLGGKLRNQVLTSDRRTTGYNTMVRNLDTLLKHVKADEVKVLKDVSEHLFKQSYKDQKNGIVSAILNNAKIRLSKSEVERAVDIAMYANSEVDFNNFLKSL